MVAPAISTQPSPPPSLQHFVHNNHSHHALPKCDAKKDDPVMAVAPPPAAAVTDAPAEPRHHCRGCLNKCQTCEDAYCMT
jgi:hypothetical protein